ncbi:division/cell wall cluster transcriptional repressor MraZ [Nigerium massiliense]|uniref:division/cell wall cluster transcriptional repressor MraZ n=1 Tax=Nigerium massiliense TaxID=1522317 RepID=UPI00058BB58E|nr:division/cell wall cluster transcriptional repressor MraZ [Nigerium massiliense]
MFLGTYTPRLDEKGRFFLPAKFRDELAEGLVIAKGQEHCLTIYTPEGFQQEAARAMSGPSTLRGIRDFQRMYASGASEEVPDKQGRLTVPPMLRQYAGLDKEIAVIGAFNRIEVWDLPAWEAYQTAQEEEFAQMDGEIAPKEPLM